MRDAAKPMFTARPGQDAPRAGRLSYYSRNLRLARQAWQQMTVEEEGVLTRLTDAIVLHEGEVPDDDRMVARMLGVDIRVWRRVRARLEALGWVRSEDGWLRSRMSDDALPKAQAAYDRAVERNQQQAEIRRQLRPKSGIVFNGLKRLADQRASPEDRIRESCTESRAREPAPAIADPELDEALQEGASQVGARMAYVRQRVAQLGEARARQIMLLGRARDRSAGWIWIQVEQEAANVSHGCRGSAPTASDGRIRPV